MFIIEKLTVVILIFCISLLSFSESNLDSLLQDDKANFEELGFDEKRLEPKEAYVEELVGEAFIQKEGSSKWIQIIEKSLIKEKDTLITGERSNVKIRMEEDVYINLGENSRLYFDTMRGEISSESLLETGLKLAFGKVFSNVRRKLEQGGRYEIEVGSVVAGVRGTQYLARLNRAGEINVKVYEGKVYCRFIDKEGNTVKKKKKEGADEVSEVVLGKDKEFIIVEGDTGWNITPHNETAPLSLEQLSEIPSEF